MTDIKDDIRQQLESTLEELKTTAGEIKDRLGETAKGAKDEAKAQWRKLEPRVHSAEQELREAGDAAVVQLKGVFGELKDSLRSLREKL